MRSGSLSALFGGKPDITHLKTGWTDTGQWREEDFLYNHEAPIPGHHRAEDKATRFEHVDLTIEANACGHEGP